MGWGLGVFLGTDARGVGTGSKPEAGAPREVAVALDTAWYTVHWAEGARLRTPGELEHGAPTCRKSDEI